MQYNLIKDTKDTIVAIATPMGIGAIMVIRISGNEAISCVEKIFRGKKKLSKVPSHKIEYGNIVDEAENTIDDVLVSVFKSPHSYTGEDSCEIGIHGSQVIAQKIMHRLIAHENVRLAKPGEFTRRAFLNGRLDLAQAEAVVDVIEASTEASLRGARNQLDGVLSSCIKELRSMLIETCSLVELELDFAEEEIEFLTYSEIEFRIQKILDKVNSLIKSYSFGKIIKDGIHLVIVGKPNVGKSSLLNYMLKESRAIVSHVPGTTRDIIREEAVIDGLLFKLYDTAGIRITQDEIEQEGVNRSKEAIKNADIVLLLHDASEGVMDDIYQTTTNITSSARVLSVLNKIDLCHDERTHEKFNIDAKISAKTGEGIENLFQLIKQKVYVTSNYTEETAIVSNIRHYNSLKKSAQSLELAKNAVLEKLSGEFIATDLHNARLSLEEIIGIVTSEDILNHIFSRFCIGK